MGEFLRNLWNSEDRFRAAISGGLVALGPVGVTGKLPDTAAGWVLFVGAFVGGMIGFGTITRKPEPARMIDNIKREGM